MNLFQNSNSNTWRGQQSRNTSHPDGADIQNNPRRHGVNTQDSPYGGADTQNNPCQDSTSNCGSPQPDSPGPQNSSGQNWMDNPALAGIDPSRLQMLSSLAAQAQNKNQNELLPFLMAAASQKNTGNMSFRPDEIETIINVMKIGKSPQEIRQIDRICSLMRQFGTLH